MGVKINIVLVLSLATIAAANKQQEDGSEARVLFSNYTSGLDKGGSTGQQSLISSRQGSWL